MKLNDYGCFFVKPKDDKLDISVIIYCKTNFLLKMKPPPKLRPFDSDPINPIEKSHSPNKVWFVIFGKDGTDGPSPIDVSYKDFESMITNQIELKMGSTSFKTPKIKEYYDYSDYTAETLYETMKKGGLKPYYKKKWFEEKYQFIEGQLSINRK